MMWPFSCSNDEARIAHYRQLADQYEDELTTYIGKAAAAESKMHKMQRAKTDEGLEAIVKGMVSEIADVYAGHRGGVKARDEAVYVIIHKAVREAVMGEAHWNTKAMAQEAYRE